ACRVRWRKLGGSTFFSPLNSVTRDRGSGVIGGGQLGYNFQYNRFVFGIEGSASAADFDRSFASPYFPATDVWSSKLTWIGTVTGRVGYGLAPLHQRRLRRRHRGDGPTGQRARRDLAKLRRAFRLDGGRRR